MNRRIFLRLVAGAGAALVVGIGVARRVRDRIARHLPKARRGRVDPRTLTEGRDLAG